jgi:hypothetical protein
MLTAGQEAIVVAKDLEEPNAPQQIFEANRRGTQLFCVASRSLWRFRITTTNTDMPKSKAQVRGGKIARNSTKENPGHSLGGTSGIPGPTGNRTTTERRVGSGNTRTGSIEARKAAGES